MIGRILSMIALHIAVILIAAVVLWQTWHLIDWTMTLYEASGNGTVSSYLRHHAYTYVEWFFGTDFGWRL